MCPRCRARSRIAVGRQQISAHHADLVVELLVLEFGYVRICFDVGPLMPTQLMPKLTLQLVRFRPVGRSGRRRRLQVAEQTSDGAAPFQPEREFSRRAELLKVDVFQEGQNWQRVFFKKIRFCVDKMFQVTAMISVCSPFGLELLMEPSLVFADHTFSSTPSSFHTLSEFQEIRQCHHSDHSFSCRWYRRDFSKVDISFGHAFR